MKNKKQKRNHAADQINSKLVTIAEVNKLKGKVFTAKDVYRRMGAKDMNQFREIAAKKSHSLLMPAREKKPIGKPITACLDYGRLIAKCECGGAEYIDPDDLRFFCQSCGNIETGRRYRPVIIPDEVMDEL